ncbi:hypothetical protein HF563_19060, partial [Acidithiobacillus ferridurans]|nr:hypothetical protein [Acidithiobacillus ferridurans]
MNAVYRLVVNRALGCLQVASELSRAPRGSAGQAAVTGAVAAVSREPQKRALIRGLHAALATAVPLLMLGAGVMAPGLAMGGTQKIISSSISNLTISGTGTSNVLLIPGGTVSGTLSNIGSIVSTGTANSAISVSSNSMIGTLNNSGVISGVKRGVQNSGSIDYLSNSGGIIGVGLAGISNSSAGSQIGTLINHGSISGFYAGVGNNGVINTLTNFGTITGQSGIANADSIGALINSGTITGNNLGGIVNVGNIGVLTNSGDIYGSGTAGAGVVIKGSATIGSLTNSAGGSIVAQASGIVNYGSIATLTNSGVISAKSDFAIANQGTIGAIINSGVIQGGAQAQEAVVLDGAGTTLTNTGTIIGGSLGSAIEIQNSNAYTLLLGAGSDIQGAISAGNSPSTILMTGAQSMGSNSPIQAANGTLTITSSGDVTATGSWTLATVTNGGTLAVGTPGSTAGSLNTGILTLTGN